MRYFFVVREARGAVERFCAQVALKRPFAGVPADMEGERAAHFELLGAQMAGVRKEVVVDAFVREQRIQGDERSAADLAGEGLLAGVNAPVLLARLPRVETLVADIARVVADILVNVLDVLLEQVMGAHLLTTKVARELALGRMHSMMRQEADSTWPVAVACVTVVRRLAVQQNLVFAQYALVFGRILVFRMEGAVVRSEGRFELEHFVADEAGERRLRVDVVRFFDVRH